MNLSGQKVGLWGPPNQVRWDRRKEGGTKKEQISGRKHSLRGGGRKADRGEAWNVDRKANLL